jgi:serine phosphatase RsbU (regulator of sigma subunit)
MQISSVDKQSYLKLLNQYFESALAEEIINCPVVEFPAGMKLGNIGEEVTFVSISVKGKVKVIRYDDEGHELLLYNVVPVQTCVFSLTAAMLNNMSKVMAITEEDTIMFVALQEQAKQWLLSYQSWRDFVIELYEKRLDELLFQHETTVKQKDEISRQKKEITDSIIYAQRIQKAVLPPDEIMKNLLPEYFVLYKPRNIVSGDYYWLTQIENKTIVIVADCTGHGVPGAFMSMLGISLLNQMISQRKIKHANEIMDDLRANIKKALRQTGKESDPKDGMDLVLMIFDFDNNVLEYSGAYNPIYIIHEGKLVQTEPDHMPIGIHDVEKGFSLYKFPFSKGDVFYAFSDGYADQFGGENSKRFMSKQFRELLLKIHQLSMEEQKNILECTLEKWKGNNEQVDDILVMSIRV